MTLEEIKVELRRLNEQVADLRATIARDYLPRSDFVRRRRQFFLTLGIVVVLLASGGWFTQRMTLAKEHQIVRTCFLRPAILGPATVSHCTAAFGTEYADLQAQSARASATFVDLQQRVKQLEDAQRKGQ